MFEALKQKHSKTQCSERRFTRAQTRPCIQKCAHAIKGGGSASHRHTRKSYLFELSQIWRQFQTGDITAFVTDDEDSMFRIELDVRELGLLLLDDGLLAQGLVLVDVQIEHVRLRNNEQQNDFKADGVEVLKLCL